MCDKISLLTGVKTRNDGPNQVELDHIVKAFPRSCDAIEWTLAWTPELASFAGDVEDAEQCFVDID